MFALSKKEMSQLLQMFQQLFEIRVESGCASLSYKGCDATRYSSLSAIEQRGQIVICFNMKLLHNEEITWGCMIEIDRFNESINQLILLWMRSPWPCPQPEICIEIIIICTVYGDWYVECIKCPNFLAWQQFLRTYAISKAIGNKCSL